VTLARIITVEKDYKELGNISDEKSDPETIRQLAEKWANTAPECLKMGSLWLPPQGIFNHLGMIIFLLVFGNLLVACTVLLLSLPFIFFLIWNVSVGAV
jgi:hypothetical protein